MPRKTKEEIRIERRDKFLSSYVQSNKYLRNSVHYKNNYWCWAAWDSWAAQGKAGSCPCGCGYYNGSLKNKRRKTHRGGRNEKYPLECSHNFCYDCVNIIEEKINHKFPRH